MTLPPPPAPDPAWAWFFDIDGTLIEFSGEPSSFRTRGALPDQLRAINRKVGGALALVSGRALSNVQELIAPIEMPLAGCHGMELRFADGRITRPAPSPNMARARRILQTFAGQHEGLLLEDKGVVLTLHYRKAPQLEAATRATIIEAAKGDLGWLAGHALFEIKPKGSNKGDAVTAFMATEPFRGRKPIFIGDDLTDEDGFAAARAAGGQAVLVGAPRPTKAMFRLENVSSLHAWLAPFYN